MSISETCVAWDEPENPFDESQPCSSGNLWMPHCAEVGPVGIPGSANCSWGSCAAPPGSSEPFGLTGPTGTSASESAYAWGTGFCPAANPGCLLELEAVDNQMLDAAMYLINQTKLECKVAFDRVRAIRQAGRFYRGNPALRDSSHDAQSQLTPTSLFPATIRTGTRASIHVETAYLRSANPRDLAELLVHEGMHFAFASHGLNEPYPYTTYPYSEAGGCVN